MFLKRQLVDITSNSMHHSNIKNSNKRVCYVFVELALVGLNATIQSLGLEKK